MKGLSPAVAALLALVTAGLASSVACGDSQSTTPPAAPTPTPTPVTIAAPVLSNPTGGAEVDEARPTLVATNSVVSGSAGTLTYTFEISSDQSFPNDPTKDWWQDKIPQGSSTTSWTVPADIPGGTKYYWRVRSTNGTITSDWSTVADFKTKTRGGSFIGQTVWDPLTDGRSVGVVSGGTFIQGKGWQARPDPIGLTDSIRYYIPGSMAAATLEFDLLNIKTHTGVDGKDIKFLSMGEASAFGSFQAFRDHPWKMHIEKRDEDPVGSLKIIWREGCATYGNCDHAFKTDGLSWDPNHVYHWTFRWGGGRILVKVDDVVVLDDGHAGYNVPGLVIELGCTPRSETMPEAIWSNVKITPGTSGFGPW